MICGIVENHVPEWRAAVAVCKNRRKRWFSLFQYFFPPAKVNIIRCDISDSLIIPAVNHFLSKRYRNLYDLSSGFMQIRKRPFLGLILRLSIPKRIIRLRHFFSSGYLILTYVRKVNPIMTRNFQKISVVRGS